MAREREREGAMDGMMKVESDEGRDREGGNDGEGERGKGEEHKGGRQRGSERRERLEERTSVIQLRLTSIVGGMEEERKRSGE